jgi:hypothetical protein
VNPLRCSRCNREHFLTECEDVAELKRVCKEALEYCLRTPHSLFDANKAELLCERALELLK